MSARGRQQPAANHRTIVLKLAFSIDALNLAGDRAWRLLDDGEHWRPCRFAEELAVGDARLSGADEVAAWIGLRLKRDRELGLKALKKPGMFDFFMRGIFAHAIVHRFAPAPVPDRAQLAESVAATAPGRPWLVYLDLGGCFRTLDSSREPIIGNPSVAVRGEIASSPEYIGSKAAANTLFLDELYRQFLGGWLIHLQSRRLGVFVPDVEKLGDIRQLQEAIYNCPHE